MSSGDKKAQEQTKSWKTIQAQIQAQAKKAQQSRRDNANKTR